MARFRLLVNINNPEGDNDARRVQFKNKIEKKKTTMMKRWREAEILTTIHFTIKRTRLDYDNDE